MGAADLPKKSADSDVELQKLDHSENSATKRYRVHIPEDQDALFHDPLITDVKEWYRSQKRKASSTRHGYTWFDWAVVILPCLGWLRTYKRSYLVTDIAAGLSVAALVIPQSMSYAKLAGLPNQFGLYGAFVPVIIYACLGSSRQLAVGPVAVTSLLLGTGLKDVVDAPIQSDPNNPTDPEAQTEYNHAAIQVALLAGLLYSAVGFLQLGWIINFLSHSVIAGFVTGASVIIGLQQVKFLFGYNSYTIPPPAGSPKNVTGKTVTFPRSNPIHEQLGDLFGQEWIHQFRWREFIMGTTFLVILLTMKHLGQRYKKLFYLRALGPLTVTVLGIAIVNIFDLQCDTGKTSKDKICYSHIRVVGKIPKGLPKETVTWWFPMSHFGGKIGYAVIICLVDILESISIAKALAYKNHYELIPGRELRGLGIANLAGSMFSCYTTTGSFSRSAVMDQCGANTQLAAFVQAIIVGFTLLVLTPVFKNMPQNAQGAIIISAIIGLFNYSEFIFLWKINKLDWVVFNVAWLGVMFAGIEIGLAIAVGVSLLLVLYKTGFPHMAVLGRLPGTTIYRNVKQYPEARQTENLLVLRIDAPIYFANVTSIRDNLQKYQIRLEQKLAARGKKLEFIIIDLSPVSDIDASAVHFLTEWIGEHKRRDIQTVFANPSRQVVQLFERAGIPKLVGEEFICVRTHDAVTYCQEILAERGMASVKGGDVTPLGKPSPDSGSSATGSANEVLTPTSELRGHNL